MKQTAYLVGLAASVLCIAPSIGGAQCLGDFNYDGVVTIDELVTAVNNALNGCQLTPARFADNGDGTITDHSTGLMWEKKDTTCPGPHCVDDAFTWCSGTYPNCTNSANPPDGTAFTTFLYQLNAETTLDYFPVEGCFANHCDWRLPTIFELEGIVDFTQGACAGGSSPCIDPIFGPTQGWHYWSGTTDRDYSSVAWGVFFEFGTPVAYDGKWAAYPVRAVRGGF